jgi:hypothetical protein
MNQDEMERSRERLLYGRASHASPASKASKEVRESVRRCLP